MAEQPDDPSEGETDKALIKRIHASGLTPSELAKFSDLSPTTVGKVVEGKLPIRAKTKAKVRAGLAAYEAASGSRSVLDQPAGGEENVVRLQSTPLEGLSPLANNVVTALRQVQTMIDQYLDQKDQGNVDDAEIFGRYLSRELKVMSTKHEMLKV